MVDNSFTLKARQFKDLANEMMSQVKDEETMLNFFSTMMNSIFDQMTQSQARDLQSKLDQH